MRVLYGLIAGLCLPTLVVARAPLDTVPDHEGFAVDDIDPHAHANDEPAITLPVFRVPADIKENVLAPIWSSGWDEFEFASYGRLPELPAMDKISDVLDRAKAVAYILNEGLIGKYEGKSVSKADLPWDEVENVWLWGSTEYITECGPDSPNPTDCWRNRRDEL